MTAPVPRAPVPRVPVPRVAVLLEDRSADPQEPLRVYADPAGHPFCLIAAIAGV